MNVIANNNNYIFQLVGVYILSGIPEHVVLGDGVTVTLTCVVDDYFQLVASNRNSHAPKRIVTKNVIPPTERGYLGDMYLQSDVCTVVGSSCH